MELQQVEEKVNQQVSKLEDTLAVYLLEIKQENDSLLQQLDNREIGTDRKEKNTNIVNTKVMPEKQEKDRSPIKFSPIEKTDEMTDTVESSLTSQVLHLKEKGYTVEKIAKELDKGKTEIELLLKFYHKK